MQVMAKLLKDNNVLQMNIIDREQKGTNNPKAPSVEKVKKIQETTNKRRNVGGNDIKILKRNILTTNKINSNDPRDIVFAILSEDARKRAFENMLNPKQNTPGQRKKSLGIEKEKPFDSVTFLMHSGYSKEHFNRLLSKVLNII